LVDIDDQLQVLPGVVDMNDIQLTALSIFPALLLYYDNVLVGEAVVLAGHVVLALLQLQGERNWQTHLSDLVRLVPI